MKKGDKRGTDKNDSPANLLFTSVCEHTQYSSPVSRSTLKNRRYPLGCLLFFIVENCNRNGTTYHDWRSHGENIVFIRPSNIKDDHRPDIIMDGVEWELKCPQGCSKRTIERLYRTAAKQSKYIIFDLRRKVGRKTQFHLKWGSSPLFLIEQSKGDSKNFIPIEFDTK